MCIISFLARHNEPDDKKTILTYQVHVLIVLFMFCRWRHHLLLIASQMHYTSTGKVITFNESLRGAGFGEWVNTAERIQVTWQLNLNFLATWPNKAIACLLGPILVFPATHWVSDYWDDWLVIFSSCNSGITMQSTLHISFAVTKMYQKCINFTAYIIWNYLNKTCT